MINKLDLIDKKILSELDINARQSNSAIGKKVNLSKQSVQYRIDKMIKSEIINGFYTVIDVCKLGYLYCRVALEIENINKQIEKEIIEYCLNNNKIGWIIKLDGKWDLSAILNVRNNNEIKEVIDDLLKRFANNIKKYDVSVANRVEHYFNRFLTKSKDSSFIYIGDSKNQVELDSTDKKILSILNENARIKLVDLAKKINKSYKVITYRIKLLQQKGVIKAFKVNLNYKKLGYTHYKFFLFLKNFDTKKIDLLKNYIRNNMHTIFITEAIGLADLEFEILMPSYEDYHDFVEDLRDKFSDTIKSYNSLILYKFFRLNYLPNL